MSSEAVGTAGNGSGIVRALFLAEEVELKVVWAGVVVGHLSLREAGPLVDFF